jgi:hypothetical protein
VHAEVVDDVQAAVAEPQELVALADALQLRRVAARDQEARQRAAARLQRDRLEAVDLAGALQPAVVRQHLVEHLQRVLLAAAHRLPPHHHECPVGHDVSRVERASARM